MNRTRNAIILVVVTIGLVGALFSATMTLAGASSTSFSFTTDPNVGIEGPPGSLYHVGYQATPTDMVGQTCDVVVDVANNDSVRPGTDLVVGSGGQSVVLLDTEGKAGNAPALHVGTLTLGTALNAWVKFGPAGVASVDATIHVNCPDTPPTTTVPPPVQPPTPVPPTPVTATPTVTG